MSDAAAQERRRLYEDRWSSYGANAGILRVSDQLSPAELKRYDLFKPYDDEFLLKHSPDIAVVRWKRDAILFEEGSYLDLAFYIIEGTVNVFLAKHHEPSVQPIFDAGRTSFLSSGDGADEPATLSHTAFQAQKKKGAPADQVTFLSTMDFNLPRGEALQLSKGDIFGEIGALNGWPQSVTAQAATDLMVVQIRLPALRDMKKKSKDFGDHVDRIYRERTLMNQLESTPLLRGTDEQFIKELARRVELVSLAPGDELTVEGAPVDALYMVRSGFLKLSQTLGGKPMAVSYLSKGMTLGEVELQIDGVEGWQFSTNSVGYSELVKIPASDFFDVVRRFPSIERRLWEAAVAKIKDAGYTKKHIDKSDLIDFALAKGLVQGNSILVMDLDVCTRCDDCVRGCASTHGGRPRFVREGEKYNNFLIARSCYHCEDPVCLIGCPTGAIQRANIGEVVWVDDTLCIGCSNCANKCPYDAIVMHDTGTTWSENALPEYLRGRDRKVASKCDLCFEAESGPACVNNCPHSCAFRVGSIEDFQQLLSVDQSQR